MREKKSERGSGRSKRMEGKEVRDRGSREGRRKREGVHTEW